LVTSSFEYFPGVPIFHSRDLVNWQQIGHCLTRRSQLNIETAGSSQGVFAPTIRHHAGRFTMVTTHTQGLGNFFVWTENPAGEWSEPVRVAQGGIDPSLLFHEGRVYFASAMNLQGQRGAYVSEIDIQSGKLLTQPRFVWGGTGGRYAEAPHIYPRDGWFYLVMAEGGTEFGHMVTIARSRNIYGPYESCPHNPIFSHRSTWSALQSTGHGDFFQDPQGRDWMVFLAARHVGYPPVHHMGRETCLTPVSWPRGEWPSINGGAPLPDEIALPTDWKAAPVAPEPPRDDFDAPELASKWNFRRNPVEGSWSLARRASWLSLRCLAPTLDEVTPQSFVGRKQEHFAVTTTVRLDIWPSAREEAGLVAIMNERYYAAIVVAWRNGNRVALVRRRFGNLRVESAPVVLHSREPIELRIRAQAAEFHLEARLPGGWHPLETVETRHLSTEIAGGFTGVFFGMFASGGGQNSNNWATFDWFDYVHETPVKI
jgi:alpha-N-arabinofuranosidase